MEIKKNELWSQDYLIISDMDNEELMKFTKKEMIKTAKQLNSELDCPTKFNLKNQTKPQIIKKITDLAHSLHIEECSLCD